MSKPGLRVLAYALPVLLLGAALVLLLTDLRNTAALQRQVADMDARLARLSLETESQITGLSREFGNMSKGMQDEIAAARRRTGGDVSRVGSRLSGRLDEMGQRMEDIAAATSVEVRGKLDTMSERMDWASAPTSTTRPEETALHEVDAGLHALEVQADALFDKGRYREASAKFSLILEKQPANTDLRLKRAVGMFRANPGDTFGYATIERDLKSALEIKGENAAALETLALLAAERREWLKTSAYFRRLLAVEPRNGNYLREAAECLLIGGNFDEARAYIEEALRLFPHDEETIALAGRLHDASSTGGSH
jgi:tetratricopeptide (TPR) repeat protein